VAADWGSGLSALGAVWPDEAFVLEVYPKAVAVAEWLSAERDREESGLFDMARDDPSLELRSADARTGRIKGTEAAVYAYLLYRWLERSAPDADGPRWTRLAERTRTAVREKMWNGSAGMFSDVDAKTHAHMGVKHARCFLPYRTDIVDAEHLAGLEKHLLDPAEFFSAFPVPSLSADDPRFSAEGEWKSRRAGDPWNGRSHPEVNAEVVDALAHVARTHAPHLRAQAATLLRRFVRMMFHDGELHRVNSHEHYNPLTGHASVYRGADDVQHAWLNDLIIRHVIGIDAGDQGLTIDPLPFGLEHAEITGVRVRGRVVDVLIEGQVITVTIDGVKSVGALGTPMVFATPSAG
jgi:glycogen debranching enzyme